MSEIAEQKTRFPGDIRHFLLHCTRKTGMEVSLPGGQMI
jgi:hypothetical protein